jgi:hypothetical protein
MRPTAARTKTAESIALETVEGTGGRAAFGGLKPGSRAELAEQAAERAKAAGREVEAYQALQTPTKPQGVVDELRHRADRLESRPPDRMELHEVDTGLVDEFGDPIMGIQQRNVKGQPVPHDPALVGAYRDRAAELETFANQYDNAEVPFGELVKRRGAISGKAFDTLPGNKPTAPATAARDEKVLLSELLHSKNAGLEIPDRAYRVWRNAAVNFERSRLRALTERGWRGLRDLLVGRAGGVLLGAGVGIGMGPLGGVTGALVGAALGESAFWQTLRASQYARLARALNNGQVDEAAAILQRAAAVYATQEGIADRERHARAQDALREQAEGVVAP